MALRRAILGAGMLVAVTGAVLGVSAGPAAAHINDISCQGQPYDSSVAVMCTHPGPDIHRYRAWASCSDGSFHVGSWQSVNSGVWSWANCGTNRFVSDWGYDLTPPY